MEPMAGVASLGRPSPSCSSNGACLATLDNATARMHVAAAAQLCGPRSADLHHCWQLDAFFDAVLVISLKSRCQAQQPGPTRRSCARRPACSLFTASASRRMRERGSAVRAELARHGSSRVVFIEVRCTPCCGANALCLPLTASPPLPRQWTAVRWCARTLAPGRTACAQTKWLTCPTRREPSAACSVTTRRTGGRRNSISRWDAAATRVRPIPRGNLIPRTPPYLL
jgi:hypothetical protein